MHEWLHRDRMRGQDSHETMRSGPSRVTGIGEAKPHRKAFPGGRQVRGKTRPVDRSAGQAAPGALRRQLNQRVHRCESSGRPGTGVYPLTIAVIAITQLAVGRKPKAAQLGLRRSRLSRGQRVSNAPGGAEQDERDDEAPCDLEGAASTRWPRGPRWRRWLERGHRPDWPNPRGAALVGVCPGHQKSYLADLTASPTSGHRCPFPHIRSAILKTSQPRMAIPTPQKSMTETTASSNFLHGVYGLMRRIASNKLFVRLSIDRRLGLSAFGRARIGPAASNCPELFPLRRQVSETRAARP